MGFVIKTISLLVRSCKFVRGNISDRTGGTTGAGAAAAGSEQTDPESSSIQSLYNGLIDPSTGEHLGHNLEKEELDLLINYIANRVWWRSSAQDMPMVRNSVAQMFAHVATDNLEFSHVYIMEMFKAISSSNFMTVKRYERPLLDLV